MSRPDYELNYYMDKNKFDIQTFLDLINKHNIIEGRYEIQYEDHTCVSDQNIQKLKNEYKKGKLSYKYKKGKFSYFTWSIYLKEDKKLPGFILTVVIRERDDFYNIDMSLTMIDLKEFFLNKDYSEISTKWLYNLFKDISINMNCFYAYMDLDSVDNNYKIELQNDKTYKVVEKTKYTNTPAIFNELSYFSKDILNQNNNKELVLSKDLAKVIHLKNGGLIVIDHQNKLKGTLLKLLRK